MAEALFCVSATSRRIRARKRDSLVRSSGQVVPGVSPALCAAHFQDRNIKPMIYDDGVPAAMCLSAECMIFGCGRPRGPRTKGQGLKIEHKTLSYDRGDSCFVLAYLWCPAASVVCSSRAITGNARLSASKIDLVGFGVRERLEVDECTKSCSSRQDKRPLFT